MPDPGSFGGQPQLPESESIGIEIGAVIAGKYRVDRVIGKGGMGVVVAASQLALERTVAIKLIRPEFAREPMAVERLLREARAAASIKSEHVTRVLDVGTLEVGVPFIVMEYLEGSDLQTLLEREGPMPVADAVDFVLEACEAIAEAHRNGIVHRDIKPANLFLALLPGGRQSAKVVDFGISKLVGLLAIEPLTQPSGVVGSLYHMAPEQMRGEAVDARTDLWALGLVLFEMITGTKPFRDQAWPAVCAEVLYEPLPMLADPVEGLSEELRAVIMKCLRRMPEDRFGNVADFAVSLSRFGSRRAHASLERIVLLATSTGSLSAYASPAAEAGMVSAFEPAFETDGAMAGTRPVPLPGVVGSADAPDDAPSPAGPSTPLPVSSSPRVPPMTVSRKLSFGVAGVLLAVVPALVWLWLRPPSSDGGDRAPATLDRIDSSAVESAPASARPGGSLAPERPTLPESRSSPAIRVLPMGNGGSEAASGSASGPSSLDLAPGAPGARASGAGTSGAPAPGERAAQPGVAKSISPEARGAASSAPEANASDTVAAAEPGSEPLAPSGDEAAAPAEVGGAPQRGPSRSKPASPWDLDDITFEDKAKR
jgi:serine/threonine protein kinase